MMAKADDRIQDM